MTVEDALEIVLDLAKLNPNPEDSIEATEAINVVEDYIVNVLFED